MLVLYRLPRVSYASPAGGGDRDRRPAMPARLAPGPPAQDSWRQGRCGPRGRYPRAAVAGQGFGLVWLGKFLIVLAETIALLYLYYYLQDVVHYRNPGQGQLILI